MFLYFLILQLALGEEATAVIKGDPVPFDGILLPRELAIEILSDEYKSKLENQTELKFEIEKCKANHSFTKDMTDITIKSQEQEIEYLNKAIDARDKMIQKENGNISKSVNFIGGFAGGALVTLGVLWTANQILGE